MATEVPLATPMHHLGPLATPMHAALVFAVNIKSYRKKRVDLVVLQFVKNNSYSLNITKETRGIGFE